MIWYTIDQAAHELRVKPRTIQRYLEAGMPSHLSQIDGRRYIREPDLLAAEARAHGRNPINRQKPELDRSVPMSYLQGEAGVTNSSSATSKNP